MINRNASTLYDGANDYTIVPRLLVDVPMTLCAWFKPTSLSADSTPIGITDPDVLDHFHMVVVGSSGAVSASSKAGGTLAASTTSDVMTVGNWHHAAGVWKSAASRVAFLDGRFATINTDSRSPSNMDETDVGVLNTNSTAFNEANGALCEVAAWNEALTTAEVQAHASGVPAYKIRPHALVIYMPDGVNDVLHHPEWTVTGAPVPVGLAPQVKRFETIFVPLIPARDIWTPDEIAGGIVEGSITFDTTLDKSPTIQLTAETAASFLVNLAMAQSAATPTKEASIAFDIDVDQLQTNVADRPVSLAVAIDLDLLPTNQADMVKSQLFNLSAGQAQTNTKVTGNIITFSTDLSFALLNQLIGGADVTFTADFSINLLNQLITEKAISFNIDLALNTLNNLITDQNVSFDIDLAFGILGQIVIAADISFNTTLAFDILNQLIARADASFNIDQTFDILNQLIARTDISFDSDLTFNVLNQLAAVVSITLNTELDFVVFADGAGEISAFVTFLANVNQVQTNTITASKAFSLAIDLADQYNTQLDKNALLTLLIQASDEYTNQRGIPEEATLGITLDQTQTNLANRVAALTLATAVNQTIETQLDYNLFVNLATTLTLFPITEGESFGNVDFAISVNQVEVSQKTTAEAIVLSLQQNIETDIHLTASGEINLGVDMEQLQNVQLLGQAGITFGHLLGLAQINGADLGADISFGTVQDIQLNGFVLQFEIITPDNRTLRVNFEDRTTYVDETNRTIRVRR